MGLKLAHGRMHVIRKVGRTISIRQRVTILERVKVTCLSQLKLLSQACGQGTSKTRHDAHVIHMRNRQLLVACVVAMHN
jgi:hypothetical protein